MHTLLNRLCLQLQRSSWVFLLTIFVSGCATQQHINVPESVPPVDSRKITAQKVSYPITLGAHRGDSVIHVENTLAAIHSARQNPKYKFIEFDVQYSADKQAVVFHDSSLRRIFGKNAQVKETPYEELRRLSENQIPTYEETMALAVGKPLNIEIKSQGNQADDEQLIDYIMADLKERGITDQILISSISAEAIKYVKSRHPEMPTGQIFWVKASTYLPFDFLTEELYDEIHESQANYLMLHVANQRNINDLLRLKPEEKNIVFWDFDDTMFLVHKDPTDRLWSEPPEDPINEPIQRNANL